MKVKVTITRDNGTTTEFEGSSIIFCIVDSVQGKDNTLSTQSALVGKGMGLHELICLLQSHTELGLKLTDRICKHFYITSPEELKVHID